MLYSITASVSLLIVVPAIVGWCRFKYTDVSYRPLVYLLTMGLINEIVSLYSVFRYGTNTINYNIFILIETHLILWQLGNWDYRGRNSQLYRRLAAVFLIAWLVEWAWRGSIHQFFSFFIIAHALCISLLALTVIEKSFFYLQKRLFNDPVFLACSGFVIYYTYMALLEVLWMFGHSHQFTVARRATAILVIINFFVNFLYCFSILCTPRSRQSIFPRL